MMQGKCLHWAPAVSRLPATPVSLAALLAPALWNGYPHRRLSVRWISGAEPLHVLRSLSFMSAKVGISESALAATARQLVLVASGYGMHDQIFHDAINRAHVPVAFAAVFFVPALLARATARGRFDDVSVLAATVPVAILANSFACGALSRPHDRYGARIVWLTALVAVIALIRIVQGDRAETEPGGRLVVEPVLGRSSKRGVNFKLFRVKKL